MRRNKEIKIRFFEDELAVVEAKQKRTNYSRERFCRGVLLGFQLRERPPAEYAKILRELRRIGSNVYQIWQKELQTKFVDVVMLQDIYDKVCEMDEMFRNAFSEKPKEQWRA